jgi:hypothetical protein
MNNAIGFICLIIMIIPLYGLYYTIKNKPEYSKADFIFRICAMTFAFFLLLGFAVMYKIKL